MALALPFLAAHDHRVWEDFGPVSWLVVGLASLSAAWVIFKAVRYTLQPGEEEPDHIKRSILREPETRADTLSSGPGSRAGIPPAAPLGGDGA